MTEETKVKTSKELQGIINAFDKYNKKHNGNAQFVCSIMAFEGDDFEVVDDRFFAFGIKDNIKLALKDLLEFVKKEKGEFINW